MSKYFICGVCYMITLYVTCEAYINYHSNTISHSTVALILSLSLTLVASTGTLKSTFYLILSPWYEVVLAKKVKASKKRNYRKDMPLVSVIIPAWNETIGIIPTIKTVLANSYPHMEIVVINDGSTDNSDTIIQTFIAKYEEAMKEIVYYTPILYRYQKNGGKGSALNHGIALSHGDIIVCIDADCVMSEDCIAHFVIAMEDPLVMGVAGNIKVGNTNTLLGAVQAIEYAVGFYGRKADALLNTIYIVGGASGAFRREVFTLIGGYTPHHVTEDMDLSFRMQQAGMRIVYAPGAIVYTEGASTLYSLMKQRLRWTRGRFETFKDNPKFLFSKNKNHSKALTWFLLPWVIFNDGIFIFQMVLKIAVYIYCIISHDYETLALAAAVSTVITWIPLWEDKAHRTRLLLAPISWLLFLIPAFIEIHSILLSVWGIWRKRELRWQQWQRKGVIS